MCLFEINILVSKNDVLNTCHNIKYSCYPVYLLILFDFIHTAKGVKTHTFPVK